MTTTLEPTTRRKAAKASAAGQVISWSVEPGATVQSGDELGTFEDAYGPVSITAPCSGVLGRVVAAGARVAEGAPLVFIEPATSRQEGPQADTPERNGGKARPSKERDTPRIGTNYPGAPPAPEHPCDNGSQTHSKPPIVPHGEIDTLPPETPQRPRGEARDPKAPARRTSPSIPPAEVEELAMEPSEYQTLPQPAKKPARPRTRHATYHLTADQAGRIKRQALLLKLEGDELSDISESEIVRAAIENLLALDRPSLLAVLEKNRRKEIKKQYGSGFPRPERNKRRKQG